MNQTKDAAQTQNQYQYASDSQEQKRMQTQSQNGGAPVNRKFNFAFASSEPEDKVLRQPRSRTYMEVFEIIDLLSSTDEEIIAKLKENLDEETAEEFLEMTEEEILAEIKASFREEFAALQVEVEEILHGVLSKCYITGCDCHAITPDGMILAHFKASESMPEELAKGRKLMKKYPSCTCVEVYNDCCRVIQPDSTVLKVRNDEL